MELTDEQEACVLRGARLVSDTDRDEYFSLISTYLKSLREISMTHCRYAVSCAIQMLQPHRVRQRGRRAG
jgi:hypothetical protein